MKLSSCMFVHVFLLLVQLATQDPLLRQWPAHEVLLMQYLSGFSLT